MSKLIVDETKLIRKYSSQPLILKSHRWEKPYKEDLFELYINQNLTYMDLCSYFNIPLTSLIRLLKYYNIKKGYKLKQINTIKTLKERYGVENPDNIPGVKEKITKKVKDKIDIIISKGKKIRLIKYGNEKYTNREKAEKTMLERYGTRNYSTLNECKEKIYNTKLERYGDPYYYDKEKAKKTCFERYGVDNISKSKYFKVKYKETMLQNYGVEHYSKTKEYPLKCKETMKKNKSYSTSKPENNILNKLLVYYPDTIHLYVDKKRYPFECDFYIPSKDLFIEFQGTWLHGKYPYHEPYDPNNINHQKIVNIWIEKSKKYNSHKNMYDRAIKVWTIKDPLKRETARKNNLNWIEFFNENDFDNWLKENNNE